MNGTYGSSLWFEGLRDRETTVASVRSQVFVNQGISQPGLKGQRELFKESKLDFFETARGTNGWPE